MILGEFMYGYKKHVNTSFEETLDQLITNLKKEGFGVLTEIDVKKTLKKKLNVEFDKYRILGACNPPFAYKALQTERDIGLLLPCNVIIYETQENVYVSAIRPTIAMNMIKNDDLREIASKVEDKLKQVIDAL